MPNLTSRLCLDLRSDGLRVYTCTRGKGHDGDHLDDHSDAPVGTPWLTRWPQTEPLSDRAAEAVKYESDALASWASRRPTGAELAEAVRQAEPDDDPDDDEPAIRAELAAHYPDYGKRDGTPYADHFDKRDRDDATEAVIISKAVVRSHN